MSGHARASAVIAVGTVVSRITGLLRSVVLVAVIGSYGSRAADAFSTANLLPTSIYEIIAAGVITGIVVPQIVKAAASPDGGQRFVSKFLTLGTVVLLVATTLAMLAAPLLIAIYAPFYTPEQQALALSFAYWCLPQLLFYGLYALVGEVLNARRVFGPYSWAPTANNLISLLGFGLFLLLFGGPTTMVEEWDGARIALLGGTATLGIMAQALILFLFWRRVGLRVRPDFQWRGMGLRQLSRLATWTFLTVVVGQLAGLVQSIVLSGASGAAGYTVLLYAWLIFMLPHSVVTLSIGTSFYTSLAELVAEGKNALVRENLDTSIRAVGVFAFGFAAALAAASVPLSRIFTDDREGAAVLALVLCGFLVGLVPFGVLVILRRGFFAFHDTRRPFYFAVTQAILTATGAGVGFLAAKAGIIDLSHLALVVALSQSLATLAQLPLAVRLLRRHLPGLTLASTWRAFIRFAIAALIAASAGVGVFLFQGGIDSWAVAGRLEGVLGGGIIAVVALAVYVAVLALLRAPELQVAVRAAKSLRRR